MQPRAPYSAGLVGLVLLLMVAGCDTVTPAHRPALVVEAWFGTDAPLSPVRVTMTGAVSDALVPGASAPDTKVQVVMRDRTVTYVRNPDEPVWFEPVEPDSPPLAEGERFELYVESPDASAQASGTMPPPIKLRDVHVTIPDKPISAVLVDSLTVGLDSLNLAVNATTGFIYPVQVSLSWMNDGFDGWVEARLQPDDTFSSSLIDFFLLPSQVFPEMSAHSAGNGQLRWEGVYAIPVPALDSPLPEHSLRVVLTRGDNRFARFITSRDAPERREPVTNVNGGLGFVGGIASDSARVDVRQ